MSSRGKTGLFDERICPECGKHFFRPPETIYKTSYNGQGVRYYCSYTCWIHVVKRHESKVE